MIGNKSLGKWNWPYWLIHNYYKTIIIFQLKIKMLSIIVALIALLCIFYYFFFEKTTTQPITIAQKEP
jgi:hypothetical protein